MMMMPGGPGMGPGGPAGQGSNPRPKSNTHIVQPAPAPLTGQDSMGKGIFVCFCFLACSFLACGVSLTVSHVLVRTVGPFSHTPRPFKLTPSLL